MRWIGAAILAALVAGPDDITPAEFEKLHKSLRPKSGQRWESIPWKTNLLEARALANDQGKPIFIWSMNGNPLGCT